MNEEIKKQVVADLIKLPELDRKIDLLRYEMDHRAKVSPEDMINALTFGHGDGIGVVNGHVSNKTLYIALNYQEKLEEANAETTNDLAGKLWLLEEERDRILHYISLLDTRQAEIIRLTFISRKTYGEAADAMGITIRTARRLKAAALEKLCEMYSFAGCMK